MGEPLPTGVPVGQSNERETKDRLHSDSDSGDSLFITQRCVSEAELTRKPRRSRNLPPKVSDGNDCNTPSSVASPGRCLSSTKRKRNSIKLPMYSFPFLQEKLPRTGFNVHKNTKLHYAVMGGFLISVRDLQGSSNKIEDLHQASLPTIDEDGVSLSPISEDEDGTLEEEALRVVKKTSFVASSKKRDFQGSWDCPSRPSQSGGDPGRAAKHQRSNKDQSSIGRRKEHSKITQTQTSMAKYLKQNHANTLCCNNDTTVCESNPQEYTENNGSKTAAAADKEHFFQTGEPRGQTFHKNHTNNDMSCSESGRKERREKRKKASREEEPEGDEALTIKDRVSFSKDEINSGKPKQKRNKNLHQAEEVMEEINDHGESEVRDEDDFKNSRKRTKGEINRSVETEQLHEDARVRKKKKKKMMLEEMDETRVFVEDRAAPLETSGKPESVFNDDPVGEEDEAVTNNIYTSLQTPSKKKKKKRSLQIEDVLPNHEEEELSQEPAESADDAGLMTKKRKKKKKSMAFCSDLTCSETVAASWPADAEEEAPGCPRDPTSAETTRSLKEDDALRKKTKKKKLEEAEWNNNEETILSQSGDEIKVKRKKKRRRETVTLTDGAADGEVVLKKKRKREPEDSTLTDNDTETSSSASLQTQRLPEFKLGFHCETSVVEQNSDIPRNGKEKKSTEIKAGAELSLTHRKKKHKRRLHNLCEDFLSDG